MKGLKICNAWLPFPLFHKGKLHFRQRPRPSVLSTANCENALNILGKILSPHRAQLRRRSAFGSASFLRMHDGKMLRIAQIRVMLQMLMNCRARQLVASVVFGMIRMALNLPEGHDVPFFLNRKQQKPP